MNIEEFLAIMKLNADIYVEFENLSLDAKKYVANINIMTGTAQTYFEDGVLIGAGGIRYVGVGEGWMITPPQMRYDKKILLLKRARQCFERTRIDKNLWRIFAETRISETFLEHLGFVKSENTHVWTGL